MFVARDTALPHVGDFTHTLPFRLFLHSSAYRSAVSSGARGNKRDEKIRVPVIGTELKLLEIRIFFYITRSIADIDLSQMLRDDVADA